MPSLLTRCLLGAAMFASALPVVDAACPTVNVLTRGPAQVKAGKAFIFRIQVALPQASKKGNTIDATTLQLVLPEETQLTNKTKAIRAFPINDVNVEVDGSTLLFSGLQAAKRYCFKVQVRF